MNEYKEIQFQKDIHISRKLKASCLNPDLPDFLEPVEEIVTSNLPKPYEIKEQSKNEEQSKIEEENANKEKNILEEELNKLEV